MDKELFDQLHQSMNEAVVIAKDEMQRVPRFMKSPAMPWPAPSLPAI
jgi:hypothetical protein